MKKNIIISGIIGAAFFGLSYLALDLSFMVSLVIGIIALFAGNLVFSKKETIDVEELTDEEVIRKIKNLNNQIYGMIAKVNSSTLKASIKDIVESTTKIIEKVSKDKTDLKKIRTFVEYYLPVTLKILRKYDEIENQGLNSKDSKVFMKITDSKSLGRAIRAIRKELNYTQAYLSGFTGFSVTFISDLERGKPTAEIEKTIRLINILGMDLLVERR